MALCNGITNPNKPSLVCLDGKNRTKQPAAFPYIFVKAYFSFLITYPQLSYGSIMQVIYKTCAAHKQVKCRSYISHIQLNCKSYDDYMQVICKLHIT